VDPAIPYNCGRDEAAPRAPWLTPLDPEDDGGPGPMTATQVGVLVLRLWVGLNFALAHGLGKARDPEAFLASEAVRAFPLPEVLGWAAILSELGGGALLALGLLTRVSAAFLLATMLGAATVYAEHNQATVISPFVLAGAMSPVTVAGTVTQILAEALAGMAYVQLVRPGAPVVFGSFASAVSLQSGAPTFGTPEPSLVMYAAGSLARRLGVPFRSGGGLCASKIPDAQAAFEAANTLQTSALSGVNFMLHTAGWLEGGLVMGYEKFVMDADQAGVIGVLLGGIDLSENGQAMDALREVGPGSHFLGSAHTYANFERAFYRSVVADNNSFEQWEGDGSLDAAQRANRIWKKMLREYAPPPLDPAVDEALQDFMQRRKRELEAWQP